MNSKDFERGRCHNCYGLLYEWDEYWIHENDIGILCASCTTTENIENLVADYLRIEGLLARRREALQLNKKSNVAHGKEVSL